MSAIGPQFYEFIKKLDENGCKLPTSVTSRPFQPEFEFNNSSCYLCNGYYGPSFGEPVCVTCHEFLYPDIPHHLPTNLFSEKTDDGDSGNDEPSTGEIWYNDRKLTRALKKHGIPSWAFRLTWAELQSGEPAFRNVLANRANAEDRRDLPNHPNNLPEGGPNNAGQNDGPSTSGGPNAGPSGVPNVGRAGGQAGPSGRHNAGPAGGPHAGPSGAPRGGAIAGPNQGGPGFGPNDGPNHDSPGGGVYGGPRGWPNAGPNYGGPGVGANAGPNYGGPGGRANAGPNHGGPGFGPNAGPNHGGPGGGAYGGPRGWPNAGPNYGGPGGGANAGPNHGGPGFGPNHGGPGGGAYGGPRGWPNAGPNYGGPGGGANAGPNHGGPGGGANAGGPGGAPNYGGPNYPFGYHGAGPYDDGTGPAVPDDGHIRPLSSYQESSLVALSTPRLPDNLAPGLVEQLPSEVLLCMFSYLDDLSLCACALVCARWHRLVLARVTQQRWAAYATRRWPLFRPMVNIHDWHKKYQALVESCFCRNCVVQMFMQTQPPFEENAWRRNRLRNEIKMLRNTPPEGCAATPLDPKCCHWQAMVTGPVGSPYEGGVFYLYIQVPYSYPMSPPLVRFVTRILHPNVSRHGDVGIDSVHHNWSLALTISKLLISIQSLLTDPYTAVCMEPEIGDMYVNDRVRFERIARRWTWRYAMHDMYSFSN